MRCHDAKGANLVTLKEDGLIGTWKVQKRGRQIFLPQ